MLREETLCARSGTAPLKKSAVSMARLRVLLTVCFLAAVFLSEERGPRTLGCEE